VEFIDLKTQYARYKADIDARMAAVMAHGRFVMGPEIDEIEAAMAQDVGVKHVLTVGSGTVSLEIALRAFGIGPGDEVVTVPFTFISSAEVVSLVGATPVFVDIEPDSYNLDPDKLEAAITPRTRAILPVNLFGQAADYDRINAIAARHGLPVIEDAAQSYGAQRHGRKSGALSVVGSTSFFPAKPLGCYGDGGALFTDDDDLAATMKAIRTHGGLGRYEHSVLGLNGRFDTLQAAVLLAKLPHFAHEVAARERIGARYSELLAGVATTPVIMPGNTHVYAQYTIRVPNRDAVGAALKAQGIPSAVYYPKCLHLQPVFAGCGYREGDFPVAERASQDVISLPMHPFLSEDVQDRIVDAVRNAVAR